MTEHDKKAHLKQDIENYMKLLFRKPVNEATNQQLFQAVAYAVKDIVVDDWLETHKQYEEKDVKTVYYLSMEMVVWEDWLPVFWSHYQLWDIRRMAAESVTSMECSCRRLKTGFRSRRRMTG